MVLRVTEDTRVVARGQKKKTNLHSHTHTDVIFSLGLLGTGTGSYTCIMTNDH
jgi:phosphate starvation-inducible protein PhoH